MPTRTPAVAGWLKEITPAKRRRQLAETRVRLRTASGPLRTLPDLLIIGAQRSGTSSLYKYLGAHPRAMASLRKEVAYFSTRHAEGESWYRAHFPLKAVRTLRERQGTLIAFEATPDYLLHPLAAGRAASELPSARILVMLRNPIDRAISQYFHNRRLGQEPMTFAEAVEREDERLDGELDRIESDRDYIARPFRRYSYVTRGRYAEQLERWLEVFPPEQIKIVRFESFTADPAATLIDIEQFLGIDEWLPAEFANHSYGRGGKEKSPPIDDALRARLADEFRPLNQQLHELLGYDMGWSDEGGVA